MKKIAVAFSLTLCMFFAFAQDASNCADYPLFKRMAGFHIDNCSKNMQHMDIMMHATADSTFQLVGTLTRMNYVYNTETGLPTAQQVIDYYTVQIQSRGGSKIFANTTGDGYIGATFAVTANNATYWLKLEEFAPEGAATCNSFELYILSVPESK